jgi:arabinose-5-phosphate isomerase
MTTIQPRKPDAPPAPAGATDGRAALAKSTRLEAAAEVIRAEARTIARLEERLGPSFEQAVDMVLACQGMVVVTGMGKAGQIGQKISATFASTGTPSHWLHPSEALHGDLGRVRAQDVVLAISNSGETAEIKALVPVARKMGAAILAMTGNATSTLATHADCVLDIGPTDEACPMGLAPTASTSAMLALGDALTMVVLRERGFSREDYARYHPAGSLGRRLLRVEEVMRRGAELPLVREGTDLRDVLLTMSRTPGRPGAALVTDAEGRLTGIFTDGDLRRVLAKGGELSGPVDDSMGRNPKTVEPNRLVDEAERLLKEHKIDQIAVIDGDGRPIGLLDVQDVLDIRT